ncbi:MAG: amidohydrolase family protein [Pseudomonadales bacterium]
MNVHFKAAASCVLALTLIACSEQKVANEATAHSKDTSNATAKETHNAVTIYCGTLIDGLANEPLLNRTVSAVDGRITAVSEGKPEGDFIDLSKHTCLPGLIDSHAHITEPPDTADLSVYYDRGLEETMEISKANSAVTLSAGFTTIRNLGAYYGWAGRELRDRINRGDMPGPRIQASGFYLTIPAGGGDLVIPDQPEERIPAHSRLGVAQGEKQFREKAQAAVDGGADVLKAIASGAVLAYGGVPGSPEMTQTEIRAAAEVAHAAGIKLTAHAHGAQSIKDAILAGADSIEHASLADDEAIALAVKHDVAFSMDVYNGSYISTVGREQNWPEEFLRKNDETTEAQRQVFTKAHKAGVAIIYGTDSGVYPHGDNAKQFPIMVERGMTAMQAIKAATSVAAKYIGWSKDVGAIEIGRYADLIAVRKDPLEDIGSLQNVDVVIKGGERFK